MAHQSSASILSRSRLAVLHVARKQLGLADDHYRAILLGAGGVESAAELDELGFERAMSAMNRLGFRSTWTRRTYGAGRRGMATPAQVAMIRGMWRELRGEDHDDAALNAWLAKYHMVAALRFADRTKAGAILTALKAMAARRQA